MGGHALHYPPDDHVICRRDVLPAESASISTAHPLPIPGQQPLHTYLKKHLLNQHPLLHDNAPSSRSSRMLNSTESMENFPLLIFLKIVRARGPRAGIGTCKRTRVPICSRGRQLPRQRSRPSQHAPADLALGAWTSPSLRL